ncbi:DEKNAAC102802 [Brettanomyces naardenensis]|uniref:DEKNAAC102802 n=1 Tax=Brettanomyces naardenensis TaxID=13370 RepID=A0A448YLH8_BRENA|nr:DEKNAAC102802 [Brettanomyces naardenensis]
MKFSNTISIALLAAAANADLTDQQVEAVNALFQDIGKNEDEYLSFLETAGVPLPNGLVPIFEQLMTYTDDSYSTLFATLPETEYDQITQLAAELPWYSSRLASDFEGAGAVPSTSAGSETSAAQSSAATTAASASSSAPAVSSAPASSAPAVSTYEGAGAAASVAGLSIGASLFAFLLL